MQELNLNLDGHRAFMEEIFNSLTAGIMKQEKKDVLFEGTKNILNYPEYSDIQKARSFFELLEMKESIANMLMPSADVRFSIKIGEENEMEELKDCSVITAVYHIGDKGIGTMGVIGPTRMNYKRVISVLGYIGDVLGNILKDL